MKRTSWKTAIVCGLALSLSSTGLFERGWAADSKDGDKGGGKSHASDGGRKSGDKPQASGGGNRNGEKPQSGGSGKSQSGGAAGAQPSRGGNVPRSSGRGGIHAPSVAAPRQPAERGGQQPSINRTPSFSRPNTGRQPGITTPPPITVRPKTGARIGTNSDKIRHGDGHSGAMRPGAQGLRGSVGDGAQTHRSGSNQSRIVNRPFVGNTVNFNNRDFRVGHNSYQPAYYRHSGYHGYWNGNRGYGSGSGYRYGSRPGVSVNIGGFGLNLGSSRGFGYGSNYGYGGYGSGWGWGNGYGYGGYRPLGWGLGGWGLGSLYYNSGYLGYSNPYYISSYGSFGNYSYSQPIPVSYNASVVIVDNDPNSADEVLNAAVVAFKQNDYDMALDIPNKGIAQYPDDAVLHEFRSLVLFARQDYQQSASTIHSVLAVGPGWDWTTLSSMYSSVGIYTGQLRALEAFTKANPQDAASRFLLAYHYMSCGHPDAAARHLQQVVKLMPNDRVAADVLKMVSAPQVDQPSETAQQPTPQPPQDPIRPTAKPIDPATLVGTWKAARADGSKFDLTLTSDAKFTWSFAQKNQAAQTFGGTYTVEGNVLALERKDGGSLIAEVTPDGNGKFNFQLLGAPEDDHGLDFSR